MRDVRLLLHRPSMLPFFLCPSQFPACNQTAAVTPVKTCVGSCSTRGIDQESMMESGKPDLYEGFAMPFKSILLSFSDWCFAARRMLLTHGRRNSIADIRMWRSCTEQLYTALERAKHPSPIIPCVFTSAHIRLIYMAQLRKENLQSALQEWKKNKTKMKL